MKLLIVDDNYDDRKLLRYTLERHGCETIFEASDGREGFEMAESNRPDLIISDALMPRMDGFQFLRMIKMDPELKSIPFVFHSAVYTGYKEEELALSLGAEMFIVKPKEPEELWNCIAAVIEKLAQGKEPSHQIELMEEEQNFLKKYDEIVTAKLEEKVRELEDALRRLGETEADLKKSNEELEIRVAERTRELEISRAELASQHVELLKTYHDLKTETAERIQAMKELREKDQMLIQQCRMAAMGEMLSNIAHYWRQPLNIVVLKLQELALAREVSKELLGANVGKSMEIIFQLSRTIDDFRMFSAPDKEKSWFEVDQVVAKAVSFIEESFRDQLIVMDVSSTGQLQCNGYRNELGQVILNILMNARDTILERGTPNARITVRSWKENDRIVVTITDNAGGIEEEIMAKIFDPYFTTKEQGKGSGVGLFMSKKIVETQMGGRLTARNVEGCAEFRIEI
jgi:signal transduction histidine kinase